MTTKSLRRSINISSIKWFCTLIFVVLFLACHESERDKEVDTTSYLLDKSALAGYEANIDHSRMIKSSDDSALNLGLVIYRNTCHQRWRSLLLWDF